MVKRLCTKDMSGKLRKKNQNLSRGVSSTSHAVSDFEVLNFFGHIFLFCECRPKSLGSARKLGHSSILPVKSHSITNISVNSLWISMKKIQGRGR